MIPPFKSEEKRQFFRIYFTVPPETIAEVISINDIKLKLEKYIQMFILDLSAGGMKVETYLDLNPDTDVILNPYFEIEGKEFNFYGKLLWKEEKGNDRKMYGIEFIEVSEQERQQLMFSLNNYQIKKVKAISHQSKNNTKKQKLPDDAVIKMLRVLPYPSVLITLDNIVVAVNKHAQDIGITVGEKCYSTIFNRDKKCSYCKLDEAVKSEEIISNKIIFNKKENIASWLYLGDDFYLHYFKYI